MSDVSDASHGPLKPPLSGIRVIDLTRILSGPFCTMMLGDMGADVIKVEDPKGGDPVRHIGEGAEGLSWYFASFNRNKRSVVLDLRKPEGLVHLRSLLATADVLVENYRPGVLSDMGFTPEALKALNPRLVVASINGYGSTGPYSQRPAFDFVIQAMSGFMSVNGERDGPSLRSGLPITDLVAGVYAAFGIVSALRARDLNGTGQYVESPMMNGIMSMFAYLASDYLAAGKEPTKNGNDHPITSPYGMFAAADGEVAVAPSTEAVLRKFLAVLELEHLLKDERFATNAQRMVYREELDVCISAKLKTHPRDHWLERLNAAGVPSGIVQTIPEAFADPQVRHQQMVMEVEHPGHGMVKTLGFPLKLSETPCRVHRPAPDHGQHTDEVLSALQFLPAQALA